MPTRRRATTEETIRRWDKIMLVIFSLAIVLTAAGLFSLDDERTYAVGVILTITGMVCRVIVRDDLQLSSAAIVTAVGLLLMGVSTKYNDGSLLATVLPLLASFVCFVVAITTLSTKVARS